MKRGLRLLLPAIALVAIMLSVDGAAKPKSASADWPGNCIQWGATTSVQWQWINGYWQLVPVTKQICIQWGYVQPFYYPSYYNYYGFNYFNPYLYSCSAFYFSWNHCGIPVNYANCGQAYIDPWGNRYTCFGIGGNYP
jgi:hypothetical protein